MLEEKITIINKLGLHTRASAKLVNIASAFESKIQLIFNNKTVDAKSIMGVITLGATHGSILNLIIHGADEIAALDAIVGLINQRFGETE